MKENCVVHKMKVLMLGSYPLKRVYGGYLVYMHHLTQSMGNLNGVDLHIVTFGDCNKEIRKDNLTIHILNMCVLKEIQFLLYFTPVATWILRRKIMEINPDIIWVQDLIIPYPLAALSIQNKFPVVRVFVGVEEKETKYEKSTFTRFLSLTNRLIDKCSPKIKNILVETESIKNIIQSSSPDSDIYIVPNGTDYKKIQQIRLELNEKVDVLIVGVLRKIKGVDILINAIPAVIKSIPDLKLYIVGSGPDEDELKTLVRKLNLGDYVKFTGFVSEDEKYQYYKASKVVVIPSRWDCMPTTLVEAMASGKPVIGSDVGSIHDVIDDGKTGFLFKPENVEDLADKIIILLKDEKLRNEMGESAREKAKEYDWDKIAKRIVEIYKEVLSKQK